MIDYRKIADAVEYYQRCGYEYIEVPWIISLDTMLITRPPGARLFSTFAGELVASGEQSFLEMRDKLEKGKKYQCVTPCFRDEKVQDDLHLQYFLKNELIWLPDYKDVPYSSLVYKMIEEAKGFFSGYDEDRTNEMKVVNNPMPNSFMNLDIEINGIEVGSYGLRQVESFVWVYGTGCAEPRLSQAIKHG